MRTSNKGLELIKQHEGLRLSAYKCPAGVWTIGYGHTVTAKRGQTITQEQADELLRADLINSEESVKALVKVPLQQCQFDALVSFVFNLGRGAFAKSGLLKLINAKNIVNAAQEFPKWNKARVGGVLQALPGLTKRRHEEQCLFIGIDPKC
jgi:lysozyme